MHHLFRLPAALVALALSACTSLSHPARDTGPAHPPPLVLISIDGFHPDYLDRGLTPTLQELADNGARARWMTPSFPSKTFPNHYTLVTGLVPDRHGIVDNTMYDERIGRFTIRDAKAVGDHRWWDGEPVWVTAHRAGLRSAVMFWPGSEAEIGGVRPDEWYVYDVGVSANERVDRVLGWLDRSTSRRPHLILTYFEDVDVTGHLHGPDSPQLNDALVRVDAALARLMDGLRRRGLDEAINLVLVSDHGMATRAPERTVYLEDIVDPAKIQLVTLGEITAFHARPGHEDAVASAVLADHEGIRCHRREHLPPAWRFGRHARVPAFVCVLDEGGSIQRREQFSPWQKMADSNLGGHGYDPTLPSMRALFVAHGPAFEPGLLVEPFQNIHVQPLLLHLLGIEGPDTDGDLSVTVPLLRAAPPEPQQDQKLVQP
jgi:predicted AlkP superfamily pyrophosphatase or phosphodiesterase